MNIQRLIALTVLCAPVAQADESTTRVRDLNLLRTPDTVQAVQLTFRQDRTTLQIVLSRPWAGDVEAWLLAADGKAIAPVSRWEKSDPKCRARCQGAEVQYGFAPASVAAAVAVALRVDGDYRTERFTP